MKIGILTFHWGTNHGAVLQSYASMKYLQKNFPASSVEIIDYYPSSYEKTLLSAIKPGRPIIMLSRFSEYKKEKRIAPFRRKLNLTKRYKENAELINGGADDYDVLLCGSDQVWNPNFLMSGEGKITPTYFLNFGREDCKRIALSVSFGVAEYPAHGLDIIKPLVERFTAISVREKTGLSILKQIGINDAYLTSDPTALLPGDEYKDLFSSVKCPNNYIGKCILRKQSADNINKIKKIEETFSGKRIINIRDSSIEDWLAYICNADCVITNSFHCVMFCLKFHTPFWVIYEDGKRTGMNDRIDTLLKVFDLQDRIVTNKVGSKNIDWEAVDKRMDEYSYSLKEFLNKYIVE